MIFIAMGYNLSTMNLQLVTIHACSIKLGVYLNMCVWFESTIS